MEPKRILVAVVGTIQGLMGVIAMFFSLMLYQNTAIARDLLDIPEENAPLYELFLFIYSFVSLISGLLVRKLLES